MSFKIKFRPCRYERISQPYKSTHKGIDLAAPKGRDVVAVADGTVVCAGGKGHNWDWSYGNEVAIYHGNGNYTNYAHLSKICVKVGQKVFAGQKIGEVGNTGRSFGNHLHFEVHKGAKWTRVNPWPYMECVGYAPNCNFIVKTNGSNLNVRNKDNKIIGKVANGTLLRVVETGNKKNKIDYPVKGYVATKYIIKI